MARFRKKPVSEDSGEQLRDFKASGGALRVSEDSEEVAHGLRRGHLADLEVVEAILLSDPRERASGYDANPRRMAEAVRGIIDNPELHNPGSATALNPNPGVSEDSVRVVLTRREARCLSKGKLDLPPGVSAIPEMENARAKLRLALTDQGKGEGE